MATGSMTTDVETVRSQLLHRPSRPNNEALLALARIERTEEAAVDVARVLEAFTGCTGAGYHRWLERRTLALSHFVTALSSALREARGALDER